MHLVSSERTRPLVSVLTSLLLITTLETGKRKTRQFQSCVPEDEQLF
jgi:hypothetical protein